MAPPAGYTATVAGTLYAAGAAAIMITFLVVGAFCVCVSFRMRMV